LFLQQSNVNLIGRHYSMNSLINISIMQKPVSSHLLIALICLFISNTANAQVPYTNSKLPYNSVSLNLPNQNYLQKVQQSTLPNVPQCLADEITTSFIQQQMLLDPGYQQKINQDRAARDQWIQNVYFNSNSKKKVVRTIPVVVHVVHNPANSNTPDENVPDSYIFDMMNTLNEDFRRNNPDANQTRSQFVGVAADAEIEFCLASKDPFGASTTGITRTTTSVSFFDPDTQTNDMKGATDGKVGWDATKYLNIWICNISDYANSGTAGYAYLPTPGMHGSSIDGLVIDFKLGIYGGGRTATHEIGHYMGLMHTWGSNPPSCSKDDGYADTPNSSSENYGCDTGANTCSGGDVDQIENYMSYAYCQNMFSTDQAADMNSILSGTRSSLLSSDGCEPTAPPVADFTADKTTVQAGGWVNFTDISTGIPDTWSWTFGGGGTPNTASTKTPTIQFNTIGTYDVTLSVTNSLGSDNTTKTSYITVTAPSGCDTLNFPPPGTLVIYHSEAALPLDTNFFVCAWNQYGDISKANIFLATDYAPNTHITRVWYSFYKPKDGSGGTSTVDLNIWDDNAGLPGTILGTVTKTLADIVTDWQGNYYTQAAFDPPIPVSGNLFVGFTMNLSTGDSLGLISNTIGDVTPGQGYEQWSDSSWNDMSTAWGGFDVALFISPFFTDKPPTASFVATTATTGCKGLSVTFDAAASVDVDEYYWDVDGDGVYDFLDTVDGEITITYDTVGTFDVTLLGMGACGGRNTYTLTSLVTVNPSPSLSPSSADATCGSCDGTASVTVSAGTPTYTYAWNDPSSGTNSSVSSLCAGSYQVLVTDANGCTDVAGVNISNPSAMSVTTSSTIANCGVNDGTATATPTGGSSPYSYLWDDPGAQTIQTATGLAAGTYNVTITDSSGCTVETDFFGAAVVTSTPAVSVSISGSTDPTCNAGTDGSATAAGSAGDGNYTYSWNTSPVQNTATATSLSAGTSYTATVTDGNGCTDTSSVTLTEPAAIVLSTSTTTATCGNADGSATVSITSGGVVPFTYLWDDGGAQTNATASNLLAGGYNVTVTDANVCASTKNATVSDAGAPSAAITDSANVTCNGGTDGSATVTASGGNPPYTYSWSTGGTSSAETGMPAGTHSVTVTDSAGCSAAVNTTINQPSAIIINSEAAVDISCNGLTDGSITVTASGGTGTLSYSIDSGSTYPNTTGLFDSLSAGTSYTVMVKDASNCTVTGSTLTIIEPSAVTISSETPTDVTCNGDIDGTITIVASGGTGTLTYSNNGGGTYAANSGVFTNLLADTYPISVQDANGCTVTGSTLTIIEPGAINLTSDSVDASCGQANGQVSVSVSGGTSPYTYLWSDTDNSSTDTVMNLTAGSYSVTVTDGNGCFNTGSTTVADQAAGTLNMTSTDLKCAGDCDGTTTATITGGTIPFSYAWNDPGSQVTATAIALCAGTYTVTVTDGNNCVAIDSVSLIDPAPLSLDTTVVDVIQGSCTGSATVIVTGGSGSYTYLWSNAQTTSSISGLCNAGDYTVEVTDSAGCKDSITATVGLQIGVSEADLNNLISLYPNPSTGDIQISFNLNRVKDIQIVVVNKLGEIITIENHIEVNQGVYNLDLSDNSNGIYFVQIITNQGTLTKKVSIIK